MQQLIDDLKAIPGVIGACTYRSQHGITGNNLPSLFKPERLNETAKHLAKIHAAGRLNFPDLTEVQTHYEESVLVFRQVNASDYLVTVCDPGINMNLLAMSLNLAMENNKELETESPAKGADDQMPEESNPVRVDIEELLTNGPMAVPLTTMRQLLTQIIGPMATIVFADAVSRWATRERSDKGSLSKLLELICQEIGDPEKAREYRNLVREKMAAKKPVKKA